MRRILILGANGMLGHQLCRKLSSRFDVWGTFRGDPEDYQHYQILRTERALGRILAEDWSSVDQAVHLVNPDVVVNAIGIIKQRDEAKQAVLSIRVNSLFPHQLADLCGELGIKLFQISTDCVFSGRRGGYTEDDIPDPVDLYGQTKWLGELNSPNCLTLRTSIVGWELTRHLSLLEWFASQRGKRIKGYRQAIYSGLSTAVLTQLIGDLIDFHPELSGVFHVGSKPISKYDLLILMREALGWKDIIIDPDDLFHCDRSLSCAAFNKRIGWEAPGWEKMVTDLATERQSASVSGCAEGTGSL